MGKAQRFSLSASQANLLQSRQSAPCDGSQLRFELRQSSGPVNVAAFASVTLSAAAADAVSAAPELDGPCTCCSISQT